MISNAPHEWARNNGPNFYGNLAKLQPKHRYEISLTWGDAVNVDDETHFGKRNQHTSDLDVTHVNGEHIYFSSPKASSLWGGRHIL